MNPTAIIFVVANAAALLMLPRRWAPVPLLVGVCYMTIGQGIDLGPFTFTVIRLLAAVGFVRVLVRGERIAHGLNRLDAVVALWAIWAVLSSFGHETVVSALVFRLGLAYNACGIYFLLRVFCTSTEDVVRVSRCIALLLVPIAVEIALEPWTLHNWFAVFGGVPEDPVIREGKVRALGPFGHPILAGNVGAVNLPLMLALWKRHPWTAGTGVLACASMIVSSASSGPVISAVCAMGAFGLWPYRRHVHLLRRAAVGTYLALSVMMHAPVYYLLARIDIAGGSTGWYRARLIQSAFEHVDEWWLIGTDYTRHWMPSGVEWSPNHADITNHYLQMGVTGGLVMMLLWIGILATSFSFVGSRLRDGGICNDGLMTWALGTALFAHAVTSLSISYFDQSFLFLFLTPAAIAAVRYERVPVLPVPTAELGEQRWKRGRHVNWRRAYARQPECDVPPVRCCTRLPDARVRAAGSVDWLSRRHQARRADNILACTARPRDE